MDASEIRKGYQTFQAHEARDAMYKTATFLVTTFWGQPKEMADSLGVLLLTWNQAFYRYGFFDFNALEECIACHQEVLGKYRNRNILTYTNNDDPVIQLLYTHFMSALRIANGSLAGRQSPVAASKSLHLLAPDFFPLWDDKIARAYSCHYSYIPFLREMKKIAERIAPHIDIKSTGKTLLKLIDEYNYAKYTKHWI